ncbi:hypothetical protein CEXT_749121 [Caerostris extrusa]|uniref:Uncharacterized protein n=1 Tax=Caerostris extrusa TaxID=172846 RepID=A0AAV4TCE8_CAEEX|nr:hypothetical protein CEXT_749121 [Caerostris extrusa]
MKAALFGFTNLPFNLSDSSESPSSVHVIAQSGDYPGINVAQFPGRIVLCSGGTERPVEREICNRSGPIKGISSSEKASIRSRCKMSFYSRQSGSYWLEREVPDMFTVGEKRVKGK